MSKHTPGPWSWKLRNYGGTECYLVSESGKAIISATAVDGTEYDDDLIAAAPELLEALEMVRDYIRTMKGAGHKYTKAVESAIAKATGEKP